MYRVTWINRFGKEVTIQVDSKEEVKLMEVSMDIKQVKKIKTKVVK